MRNNRLQFNPSKALIIRAPWFWEVSITNFEWNRIIPNKTCVQFGSPSVLTAPVQGMSVPVVPVLAPQAPVLGP